MFENIVIKCIYNIIIRQELKVRSKYFIHSWGSGADADI